MTRRQKMLMACIGLGLPTWIALKMRNRGEFSRKERVGWGAKKELKKEEEKRDKEIAKILASGFFYDF